MDSPTEIFISYAHADNKSPFEPEGWVTAFHRALEIYLGQLVGKDKPKIWRDPRLSGNEPFAEELGARVANADALVCVLSPSYLDSEWCQRELREFLEAAHGNGGSAAGEGRVFKVVKIPVPLETLPEEMQRVLGYDFFRTDPDKNSFMTLDPAIDPAVKRDYWAKLNDLAQDMRQLLQSSRRGAAGPAGGEAEAPGTDADRPAVYLADTTFDLQREHEEIKRDLLRHGYRVVPGERLPLVAGQLEEFVRERLAGCWLSIHLVGSKYGVVPEEAEESVVALQNALAAERAAGGGLDRLIWLPPGLEAKDERQRELIEALRRDDRHHVGADLLETSLEDLKTVIHQRLERPPAETAPAAAGDDLLRVYLICDQRDLEQTAALEQKLFDRGLEVVSPVFEGSEQQVREDHEESLATCDAVLIYYGEGNELWLRRKLRELVRSTGYGRRRPLLAKAIWVAPPATPQKERLRTREATVLRPAAPADPAALDDFLRDLEDARARHAG